MKENKEKEEPTFEQKQKRKKLVIFPLMGLAFVACMWFIFAPSEKDKAKEQQGIGLNTDIPMPSNDIIIEDKQSAYEQERQQEKRQEKMRNLQDFSSLVSEETSKKQDLSLLPDDKKPKQTGYSNTYSNKQSPVQNSVNSYQDINRTLGSFYETPKLDPEKEAMQKELEELKAKVEENNSEDSNVDKQLDLMEKSFQMASKYMPQVQGQGNPFEANTTKEEVQKPSDKTVVSPVAQLLSQTVSRLQQPMSNTEFVEAFSKPRNMTFNTAIGNENIVVKNTIDACVHTDQTLLDGQSARFRLLEPLRADNVVIPVNSLIVGSVKIQGERLDIIITSLEFEGKIFPVELIVYDGDGQRGIYIPNSMEVSAAKEILANMSGNMGASISINQGQSAGEQIMADAGKGLIQGTSQYVAKKIKTIKVTLKSGYKVMLLPVQK